MVPNTNNTQTLISYLEFKSQPEKRQDTLFSSYSRNGAIYIIRSENIKQGVLTNPTGYYKMPFSRSIDIDNEDDFFIAQSIMSSMQPKRLL